MTTVPARADVPPLLCSFHPSDESDSPPRPGFLHAGRVFESASGAIDDYLHGDEAYRASVQRLRATVADQDAGSGRPRSTVRLLPAVSRSGKLLGVARNHRGHLAELAEVMRRRGLPVPTPPSHPIGYARFADWLAADDAVVTWPEWTGQLTHQVELAVVIGAPARDVPAGQGWRYVAGLTVCLMVNARDVQLAERSAGGFAFVGSNLPGAGVLGPGLLTGAGEELRRPRRIRASVNGVPTHDAHTSELLFDVDALVCWFSRIGLRPGDVISTGTPGRLPEAGAELLAPGDEVRGEIEGIGAVRLTVDPNGRPYP